MQNESKRQFLRGLTALIGASAVAQFTSGQALAAAMHYQPQLDSANQAGKLFSLQQMQILHDICAVVIPTTDSPSAAELDVHGFIDHQLVTCYGKKEQSTAIAIIERISKQSEQEFAKPFTQLTPIEQTTLLTGLEKQQLGFTRSDSEQFKQLKALLVFGYFTTEEGATQVLNYQAVPGGFKGSVSYASLKKSWGSLGFY